MTILYDFFVMDFDSEEENPSLVEKVFLNPKNVCQGEYTTIYQFLLYPNIRNDPKAIVGVLEEFAGWAQYMLEQIQNYDGLD